MKLFDTHAHVNFKDYDTDRDEVIKRSLEEGVFMINVGTDLEESKKVISIANRYKEGVYAAIGLHPIYVKKGFSSLKDYKEIVSDKVVAIGETGLDYKYISSKNKEETKELQKKVLEEHIDLAQELDIPLILHCRMAHNDLLFFLKEKAREKELKGVIHCFTGSKKEAKEYIDLGFHLGINGIIFKMNLKKVIDEIPLEKILLETDCPFLSPFKERQRNEPLFLQYIVKEVAQIKKIEEKEVAVVTSKNAAKLFKIED